MTKKIIEKVLRWKWRGKFHFEAQWGKSKNASFCGAEASAQSRTKFVGSCGSLSWGISNTETLSIDSKSIAELLALVLLDVQKPLLNRWTTRSALIDKRTIRINTFINWGYFCMKNRVNFRRKNLCFFEPRWCAPCWSSSCCKRARRRPELHGWESCPSFIPRKRYWGYWYECETWRCRFWCDSWRGSWRVCGHDLKSWNHIRGIKKHEKVLYST
jgi:hypothetical protein